MFRRRSKKDQAVEAVTEASTNPGVPVAGAVGFAMLGAAVLRRRRTKTATGESAGAR